MEKDKHWNEEKIIDFLLGKLDKEKSQQLQEHIQICEMCNEKTASWKDILADKQDADIESNVQETFIKKIKRTKQWFSKENLKWTIPLISFTLILFFIFFYKINPVFFQNKDYEAQYIENAQQMASMKNSFVLNPGTKIYRIVPALHRKIEGYAWINPKTDEIYLFIDGLQPIYEQDYQAFVKTSNRVKSLGLIQIIDQKGQLYSQDNEINELQHIILSIEPIGGSSSPTDPHAYLIELKH